MPPNHAVFCSQSARLSFLGSNMNTLWRLPAPVRSLLVSNFQSRSLSSSAAGCKHADPLRILFCGSDEFSIASLRALHDAQHSTPDLIEDVHVAHRPAKPTGRGLKTLREGNYGSPHLSFISCSVLAGVVVAGMATVFVNNAVGEANCNAKSAETFKTIMASGIVDTSYIGPIFTTRASDR